MSEEYSQKEENTFRLDLFRRLDTQDNLLGDIKIQTTKTNGRVTVLEEKTKDYTEIKNVMYGLKDFKSWLAGAVATSLTLGSIIAYLFMNYITANTQNIITAQKDSIIQEAVEQTILIVNQKYNLDIIK
jgi:hypothetical protein